jgi:uncharacterized protein involved in tellurium resistance
MKRNPFAPESKIKEWNAIHFQTVCTLTVDEGIIQDEVMEFLVPALGQIGLLKEGDKCHATRVGNTLIVSRHSNYIDLDHDDKCN